MRALYGEIIFCKYISVKMLSVVVKGYCKISSVILHKKKNIPVTKLGDHTSYELPNNGINVSLENEHLKCSGHFCAFQSHQKKLHGINEM